MDGKSLQRARRVHRHRRGQRAGRWSTRSTRRATPTGSRRPRSTVQSTCGACDRVRAPDRRPDPLPRPARGGRGRPLRVSGRRDHAVLPRAARSTPALRHVLVRHEQAAAHAADGYARASGRPGVCVATSGPGATNLVTGLATAHMDSTPVVAITGQVPRADDRAGRVPGDRHHRHHAADHQAQRPGGGRRRAGRRGARGVRGGAGGTARAGADRRAEGRAEPKARRTVARRTARGAERRGASAGRAGTPSRRSTRPRGSSPRPSAR